MLRLNTFGGLILREDSEVHVGPPAQHKRHRSLTERVVHRALGCGCYDLLAMTDPTEESHYEALWHEQTISTGQQAPLAIADGSGETVAQVRSASVKLRGRK